ncbi:MAG TPA: PepSY-associated TM helix domain-containing protein [Vicinamibacterales bacterium]|nr:PepSY-associated TM helix domain-containing protein [Vicinamibacterales bacterium]
MKAHVKTLVRHAGIWARTLHIYASMAGFVLVLLFAVTGITLNHQDAGWGEPVTTSFDVTISADAAKAGDAGHIEAALQSAINITTPASSFKAYDDEINVAFHSPGRRIQALIDRATGRTKVVWETRGGVGILNDLHKGTETGRTWRWIVDVTAVLIGFSALTGILTLVSLPKRRTLGLLTTLAGTVAVLLIYWLFVPR